MEKHTFDRLCFDVHVHVASFMTDRELCETLVQVSRGVSRVYRSDAIWRSKVVKMDGLIATARDIVLHDVREQDVACHAAFVQKKNHWCTFLPPPLHEHVLFTRCSAWYRGRWYDVYMREYGMTVYTFGPRWRAQNVLGRHMLHASLLGWPKMNEQAFVWEGKLYIVSGQFEIHNPDRRNVVAVDLDMVRTETDAVDAILLRDYPNDAVIRARHPQMIADRWSWVLNDMWIQEFYHVVSRDVTFRDRTLIIVRMLPSREDEFRVDKICAFLSITFVNPQSLGAPRTEIIPIIDSTTNCLWLTRTCAHRDDNGVTRLVAIGETVLCRQDETVPEFHWWRVDVPDIFAQPLTTTKMRIELRKGGGSMIKRYEDEEQYIHTPDPIAHKITWGDNGAVYVSTIVNPF